MTVIMDIGSLSTRWQVIKRGILSSPFHPLIHKFLVFFLLFLHRILTPATPPNPLPPPPNPPPFSLRHLLNGEGLVIDESQGFNAYRANFIHTFMLLCIIN